MINTTKPIHTLNARGNIALEVMRDYFSLTPQVMHREIQGMRHQIEAVLASKGISYDELKTALVPDRKRREIALVFDTIDLKNDWYGLDVFKQYMPLFSKDSNHSVLAGDYGGGSEQKLFDAMTETVTFVRESTWVHHTQYYIIYINNLTDSMFEAFASELVSYPHYAGYADTTYSSLFKWCLSGRLVNAFLKHRKIIIQGHEDDRSNEEDINMNGYPYEDYGYECRSLQSMYEGVFLSYKIERPVIKGFEVDTEFSLNAVTDNPSSLQGYDVQVEDAKIAYLKSAKAGSLEKAGLKNVTVKKLEEIIAAKVAASYIYNLSFDEAHSTTKFNLILELPVASGETVRLLASLEYIPERNTLRLITLY